MIARAQWLPAREERLTITWFTNGGEDVKTHMQGFLTTLARLDAKGTLHGRVVPYRLRAKREVQRQLGGKFAQGVSTSVQEDVAIDPNENLDALRRWLGTVRADVRHQLLLAVPHAQHSALAAPLIFSAVLETQSPILVLCETPERKLQLLAPIDPQGRRLPPSLAPHHALVAKLAARLDPLRGLLPALQGLVVLGAFRPPLAAKLELLLAQRDPAVLDRSERVNLVLGIDLYARYRRVLDQFQRELEAERPNLPSLSSWFEVLLSDLSLMQVSASLQAFLDTPTKVMLKGGQIGTKASLFSYLYRALRSKKPPSGRTPESHRTLFVQQLIGLVLRTRMRKDPLLWRQCHFIESAHGENTRASVPDRWAALRPHLEELLRTLQDHLGQSQELSAAERSLLLPGLALEIAWQAHRVQRYASSFASTPLPTETAEAFQRLLACFERPGVALRVARQLSGPLADDEEHDEERFAKAYLERPFSWEEALKLAERLGLLLHPEQALAQKIRQGMLTKLPQQEEKRQRRLDAAFIRQAAEALTNLPLVLAKADMGDALHHRCTTLLRTRLGLPCEAASAIAPAAGAKNNGQNDRQNEHAALVLKPKAKGQWDVLQHPLESLHAYRALVAQRAVADARQRLRKRRLDLEQRYGTHLLQHLQRQLLDEADLPLDLSQYAALMREHGVSSAASMTSPKPSSPSPERTSPEGTLPSPLFDPFLLEDSSEAIPTAKNLDPSRFQESFRTAQDNWKLLWQAAMTQNHPQHPLHWIGTLYRKGIYQLYSEDAARLLAPSPHAEALRHLIGEALAQERSPLPLPSRGPIEVPLPSSLAALRAFGPWHSFTLEGQIIPVRLVTDSTARTADPPGENLRQALVRHLNERHPTPQGQPIVRMLRQLEHAERIWHAYSRHLTLTLLDGILGQTLLQGDLFGEKRPVELRHEDDRQKLVFLGSSLADDNAVVGLVLKHSTTVNNVRRHPDTCLMTLAEFAGEWSHVQALQELLLDTTQLLKELHDLLGLLPRPLKAHETVLRYRRTLRQLRLHTAKPLRLFNESHLLALDALAYRWIALDKQLKALSGSDLHHRLGEALRQRRSDASRETIEHLHSLFVLKGELRERLQRLPTPQPGPFFEAEWHTLSVPEQLLIAMHLRRTLAKKRFIVYAPEGQKQKQIQYTLETIDGLRALCGARHLFYVDPTALTTTQIALLAPRVGANAFLRKDARRKR